MGKREVGSGGEGRGGYISESNLAANTESAAPFISASSALYLDSSVQRETTVKFCKELNHCTQHACEGSTVITSDNLIIVIFPPFHKINMKMLSKTCIFVLTVFCFELAASIKWL